MAQGPKFVGYFQPVLDALHELGDSGRPGEVYPIVIRICDVSEAELAKTNKNGGSNFENAVNWARFYLLKAGYIDSPKRGVWALTDKGRAASLDDASAYSLFREVHDAIQLERAKKAAGEPVETSADTEQAVEEESEQSEAPDERDFFNEDEARRELAKHFAAMSPDGFERYCA